MSLVKNYRVKCDALNCHCSATPSESPDRARDYARREGFDVGPRQLPAGFRQYTDYCPEHKPDEGAE